MSNVKKVFYFTLVMMVLVNCSTTEAERVGKSTTLPNPRNDDNTLLVGELRFINGNSQLNYLPETITSGIKITFRSIETKRIIEIYSLEGGLFFTNKLTEGIYEIIKFNIEISVNTYIDFEINSRYFTVIKNKINNIGLMIWETEDEIKYIRYLGEYDSVKSKFFDGQYIRNERDTREWIVRDFPIYYYRNIQNGSLKDLKREYIVSGNDSSRYQELWIFWNLIAEEQVGNYPLPYRNETVKDWVIRNLYLLPSTKAISVVFVIESDTSYIRTDKDSIGLIRTNASSNNINSTIEFIYKGTNETYFGSILLVFSDIR